MALKYTIYGLLILAAIALSLGYSSNAATAQYNYPNESPSDYVNESQIHAYNDKLILNVENIKWTRYLDTGSMKPVLDEGANGIEVPVLSDDDISIGDIVSYQASWNQNLVVHRIVDIGEDSLGKYYILKGDNNTKADNGKVRLEQIKYKTIAIIY